MKMKYKNEKIEYDGQKFDSKKEYHRWIYLDRLQKEGIIEGLERQKKFILIPDQKKERKVTYLADFVYRKNGETIVEDVKGMATREYIIKRKLMLWVHGIRIVEIR